MPGRKSSLADRYLAAIQGSGKDDTKGGVSAGNSSTVAEESEEKVKIEYTYRPPANADDADDKSGNTTALGGGGSKTGADAEDSNKGIAVNVFQTSSTEEETTTDEEGDEQYHDRSSGGGAAAAVKKRDVFPSTSSSANDNDNNLCKSPRQSAPPEFATIPLRRVGATATGSSNNTNSSGRRRLNSVASSDILSEASEPILIKKKEEPGSAPGTGSGGALAADNGGRAQSETILEKDAGAAKNADPVEEEDEDNYSFKPIEGMDSGGGVENNAITDAKAHVEIGRAHV